MAFQCIFTPDHYASDVGPAGFLNVLNISGECRVKPFTLETHMNFDDYQLGKNDESLTLDRLVDVQAAVVTLARQAQRSICLFTRHLDRALYDQADFVEAVKQLALLNRQTQIRILIQDAMSTTGEIHRLVLLGHELTSKIHFNKPDETYKLHNEEFMLVDDVGLLYRPHSDRYESRLCFNTPHDGRKYGRFFNDAWHLSARDPHLRRLDI